jgi:hypothetical protein
MLIAIVLGFLLDTIFGKHFHYFVYTGETIALWSFGAAWLIKGEVIIKDRNNE